MIASVVLFSCGASEATEFADLEGLKEAADDGDLRACLSLGMSYRDGRGVDRDHAEAMKWYRRCADAGDPAGMDNVGFMHLQGWGVPQDFHIAAAYFRASAAKGHLQGIFNLGNCHFSGQGVEQSYREAIAAWRRAAEGGHRNAIWRLAMLYAQGEGTPPDPDRAEALCRAIAGEGHTDAMLLLGELLWRKGEHEPARGWWRRAAGAGDAQARALLELSTWRESTPVAGQRAHVEVGHLYQGWNNCGATSLAMFLRHAGVDTSPYAVKRLCPQSPIGTGTDWAHLVAAGKSLGQPLQLLTFPKDDAGFSEGAQRIREHLDAGRPVVIDFTVTYERDGRTRRSGHTLLVVGYNAGLDQFVLKNPNQPSPGTELMSAAELEANWHSRGYSRSAEGRAARPLIVALEGSPAADRAPTR